MVVATAGRPDTAITGRRNQREEQTAVPCLYLEPSTDGPASRDWSTALILAEDRSMGRVTGALAVLLALAAVLAVALPTTVGNVGAVVVLGLLGAIGASTLLTARRRNGCSLSRGAAARPRSRLRARSRPSTG
ncbi:hypothetical protein K1T35_43740 [Pseudonocardia sp. DSM 110487]|uniref:hypothetical protein n=1 Tax=Pseudonocardia sp. DSM 110487 TaxID=2865833 RepID=UPI001C69A7BB|nr:hypothetical protein [Pseudonocardia sp. DSM 110487]QYN35174.1 hypothetical protein K1T35_43740 [Pseudonocardia sp. DSM 110487]